MVSAARGWQLDGTQVYKLLQMLVTILLTGLEDPAHRIRVWTQKIVLNGHHTLQLFDVSWLCQWVCNFYPRNRTICSCKLAALLMVFHIFMQLHSLILIHLSHFCRILSYYYASCFSWLPTSPYSSYCLFHCLKGI